MSNGPVVFDLRLSRDGDGLVVEGRCDGVRTSCSANAAELARLARLAGSLYRSEVDEERQKKLGADLFRAVCRRGLLRVWDRARGRAHGLELPFLVRVHLPMDEDLHRTPWEWLHDGWDFLAKNSRNGALVRWVESRRELKTWRVEGPIRLLVTRGPEHGGGPAVDWGLARDELAELARRHSDRLALELVEEPMSARRLEALFSTRPGPDVWHHIGHGRCLPSAPDVFQLLLAPPGTSDGAWIRGDRIAELSHLCPSLQMVVLATCHSGDFSGLAPRLAGLDIPCVLGFPWAAGLKMAQRMTTALYTSLLHYPPELALSFARHSVAGRGRPSIEWGQAILYARRRGFEAPARPADAADPAAPALESGVKIRDVTAGRDVAVVGSAAMDVAGIWAGRDVDVRGLARARRHSERLSRELERLEEKGLLYV